MKFAMYRDRQVLGPDMFRQYGHYDLDLLHRCDQILRLRMDQSVSKLDSKIDKKKISRLRAILLLSFWLGLSCKELSKLEHSEVEVSYYGWLAICDKGLIFPPLKSLCPIRAYEYWTVQKDTHFGPVFPRMRSDGTDMKNSLHPVGIAYEINRLIDSGRNGFDNGDGKTARVLGWRGAVGWHSDDRDRRQILINVVGIDRSCGLDS